MVLIGEQSVLKSAYPTTVWGYFLKEGEEFFDNAIIRLTIVGEFKGTKGCWIYLKMFFALNGLKRED